METLPYLSAVEAFRNRKKQNEVPPRTLNFRCKMMGIGTAVLVIGVAIVMAIVFLSLT